MYFKLLNSCLIYPFMIAENLIISSPPSCSLWFPYRITINRFKIVLFFKFRHQNAVVRGATSRLMMVLCSRLGHEKTLALPREARTSLLLTGAKMLTEGSLDTR
jgi:hypothetical protein